MFSARSLARERSTRHCPASGFDSLAVVAGMIQSYQRTIQHHQSISPRTFPCLYPSVPLPLAQEQNPGGYLLPISLSNYAR